MKKKNEDVVVFLIPEKNEKIKKLFEKYKTILDKKYKTFLYSKEKPKKSEKPEWIWRKEGNFRRSFRDLEKKLKDNPEDLKELGRPEARLESEFLSDFDKRGKNAASKKSCNIASVKMIVAPFQMPTPLCACNAKCDKVKYTDSNSGHIDILARVGGRRSGKLAIWELKDENTKSEPPEKAIKQGIVYAVFIRELLRCKKARGSDWWKFFKNNPEKKNKPKTDACAMTTTDGKNKPEMKDIPKPLKLKVIIVMPYKEGAATDFADQLDVSQGDGTKDILELEYVYTEPGDWPTQTSLPKYFKKTKKQKAV